MSEQPTARAAEPAARNGPGGKAGRKYAGLTRNQWLITGGVFAAVLGYILWRRHQASAAAAAAGQSGLTAASECTDASGNPVPCSESADSSDLAALADELDQLLAQQQAGGGGGGTVGTVGTTGTTGTVGTTGTTGTTGTGGTGTATAARLTAPTGVHLTITGKTGVRIAWTAVPGAIGYVCQCKQGGDNGKVTNGPFTVTATQANFGGLKAGTGYTALIWPSAAGNLGGPQSNQPHTEYPFTTSK